MDDDEMQQALDIRDFEIERRLDAYARARRARIRLPSRGHVRA
jgi:hypothetical protein